MISTKFDFYLPGSLNKKETMKEHLIILASDKIKYSGGEGLEEKKFLLLVSNKIYLDVLIKGI